MIHLQSGCRCSKLSVYPKNWESKNAKITISWHIIYRYYDPHYEKPKQVMIKGMNMFSRINIYWQEVLTIYEGDYKMDDGTTVEDLAISVHLCKSKLFEYCSMDYLKIRYPSVEFTDHFYEPGGQDEPYFF